MRNSFKVSIILGTSFSVTVYRCCGFLVSVCRRLLVCNYFYLEFNSICIDIKTFIENLYILMGVNPAFYQFILSIVMDSCYSIFNYSLKIIMIAFAAVMCLYYRMRD